MVLENGLVSLPDLSKSHFGMDVLLSSCCIFSEHLFLRTPLGGCFSNAIYEQANTYLKETDAGKAFKGGKNLILSGHVKNVMNLQ